MIIILGLIMEVVDEGLQKQQLGPIKMKHQK